MSSFHDANFPVDDAGRVYHVGIKKGELTNRIITVGDWHRALLVASFLDHGHEIDLANPSMNYRSSNIFIRTSKRGFTTITGRYKGVPVSIVAIGMGPSMMDFFIREIRAVVDGPLVIIRFGTCGSIRKDAVAGDLIVAEESCICRRNYDFELTEEGTNELNVNERAFELMMQEGKGPYHISKPVKADSELTELLKSNLREYVPNTNVCGGLDVTTDSFYCSQARQTTYFVDNNKHLLNYIIKYNPTASFFEMETYLLLYLSKISRILSLSLPCEL